MKPKVLQLCQVSKCLGAGSIAHIGNTERVKAAGLEIFVNFCVPPGHTTFKILCPHSNSVCPQQKNGLFYQNS